MGVVETVKDIALLVQKADNIELYQKILEMQAQIMAMLEENYELKIDLRALREAHSLQQSLVFKDNMYWKSNLSGEREAFCSRCWDYETKLVHLQNLPDGAMYCPGCKRSTPGTGPRRAQTPPIRSHGVIG
jgi:hypothetical protein